MRFAYGKDRWMLEVETWFRKAILDTILYMRLGAEYSIGLF
jgi:hypothetical protein